MKPITRTTPCANGLGQSSGDRSAGDRAAHLQSKACLRSATDRGASTHTPARKQPHEHIQRHYAGVAVQAQPARIGRRARSLLKVCKKYRRKRCCATLPRTRSGTQYNWRDTDAERSWRNATELHTDAHRMHSNAAGLLTQQSTAVRFKVQAGSRARDRRFTSSCTSCVGRSRWRDDVGALLFRRGLNPGPSACGADGTTTPCALRVGF